VDVIFGHERQVVVDDQGQLRDVEAARRNVGGHQNVDTSGFEVAERPRSRALALVAVNDGGPDAGALEVFTDTIRAALGLAENERLTRGLLRQHVREHGAFLIDGDRVQVVRDGRGDGLPFRDVHPRGIASEFGSQSDDGLGQRRGKEQGLTRARERRDHPTQRGQKAEVQHPVGLVQREYVDRGEIDRAPLHVVNQPARRRHDDVGAVLQ